MTANPSPLTIPHHRSTVNKNTAGGGANAPNPPAAARYNFRFRPERRSVDILRSPAPLRPSVRPVYP
jgi:hypothetical protein